jgi:hypothetical protein
MKRGNEKGREKNGRGGDSIIRKVEAEETTLMARNGEMSIESRKHHF